MSLINEALKRAQRENPAQPAATASSPPAGAGVINPPPATRNSQHRTPQPPAHAGGYEAWLKKGAVVLSAVLLAVLVYYLKPSPPEMGPGLPSGIAAKTQDNDQDPGQPAVPRPGLGQLYGAAVVAPTEKVDLAQDTAKPWRGFEESLLPVATTLPTIAPTTMASIAELPPASPSTASVPAKPAEEAAQAQAQAQDPALTHADAQTPPPAPAPATQPTQPEPLKLGGIVQSNGQAHAIINDQMVGVGEEVAGAKVLEIQRRAVILQREGQKITLRF